MNRTDLIFMIGPTNSGKTTLGDFIVSEFNAYGVFIGRELRAKYGDGAFKGQAAPEWTRIESLNMMDEGIKKGRDTGHQLIIVDGQPRSDDQTEYVIDNYLNGKYSNDFNSVFLLLYCSDEVRKKRMEARDTDEAKRKLAEARFQGDLPQIYKLMYQLIVAGYRDNISLLDSEHSLEQFGEWYALFKRGIS